MVATAKKIEPTRKLSLECVLEVFEKNKLIDEVKAAQIRKNSQKSKHHPLQVLSDSKIQDRRNGNKVFSIDELSEVFARESKLEYLRIDSLRLKVESLVGLVSYAYAKRLQIIPIENKENEIIFATSEPYNLSWVEELEKVNKKKIQVKFANPSQVEQLLDEVFVVQQELKKIGTGKSKEHRRLAREGKFEELDMLLEKTHQKNYGNDDNSIVKIVDWLIGYAYNERSSDIHLEPKKGLGQIRFRVDGVLKVVYKMEPEDMLSVISRLKILGDMKLDERRKPQDGRIKRFLENGKKVEMRISVIPVYYGEKMVIRIFDHQVADSSLDFIGFENEDKKVWDGLIHSKQGLILVTGPTGSGKTTTLYTSLNVVSTDEVNVCTVEDPIEMTVDAFNQMQVSHYIKLGFADAIRAFLRQDPDIIMVGEIRDLETAEVALQSSMTGHLVFSTLHTNGALATIQRLIDLGLPTFLINSSLKAVLAQRLVRRLCPHCKEKVPTSKEKWQILLGDEEYPMPEFVYQAKGCKECKQLGYQGRMCIYELVEYTHAIQKLVHPNIEISELKDKTKGMFVPFRVNCAKKVISGLTTLEEVLEIAF